jgi:MerR family transcriptional regulator/heat shock protein HspR
MRAQLSKEEPVYPISAAAKLLGISVHTLRMYEREGLIIPFKKDSNQRLYSEGDLDRIECVRQAINESKISINGIKAIYSLIPCWDIRNCEPDVRKNCPAYLENKQACWSYRKLNTPCDAYNCRECDVYKSYSACPNIRDLLKKMQETIE